MTAVGFLAMAESMLASSCGDVSMSMTPATEITAVRPIQFSLMTQRDPSAVTTLFLGDGCWSTIHPSQVYAHVRAMVLKASV